MLRAAAAALGPGGPANNLLTGAVLREVRAAHAYGAAATAAVMAAAVAAPAGAARVLRAMAPLYGFPPGARPPAVLRAAAAALGSGSGADIMLETAAARAEFLQLPPCPVCGFNRAVCKVSNNDACRERRQRSQGLSTAQNGILARLMAQLPPQQARR